MNDFDDTTFARFARRFARIEELIPEPPTPDFRAALDRKPGGANMLRSLMLLGTTLLVGVALALAAIGSRPAPTVTLPPASPTPTAAPSIPPDSSDATTVLAAYLGALRAGDCDTAGQLVGQYSSRTWHDALCGGVTHVTGFRILGQQPDVTVPNGMLVNTVLTTTGTAAGLPPGDISFHFVLQPVGTAAWRIVDWLPGIPLDPSWRPYPTPTAIPVVVTPQVSATPTSNEYVGLPSNACGGFHLKIVNDRTAAVTVTVNGDHAFAAGPGETVAVAEWLPPPYGLNLAVPWDVVITDAQSGEELFAADMPGPVDQKITLSDAAPVQTPYSLLVEGC